MHQRLSEHLRTLRAGAWISPVSDKFYREIEDILAGIDRFSRALTRMDETLAIIIRKFQEAEQAGKDGIEAIPMDGVVDISAKRGIADNFASNSREVDHTSANNKVSSSTLNRKNYSSTRNSFISASYRPPEQYNGGELEDDKAWYDQLSHNLIVNGKRYLVDGSHYTQILEGQRTAVRYELDSIEAFTQSVETSRDAMIETIMLDAITRLRMRGVLPLILASVGLDNVGSISVNAASSATGALDAALLAGQTLSAGSILVGAAQGFIIGMAAQAGVNAIEVATGLSLFGDDQDVGEETLARIAPGIEEEIERDYATEIATINEVNSVLAQVDTLISSSSSLTNPNTNAIMFREGAQTYLYVEMVDPLTNASESITVPISQDTALMLDAALFNGE